VQATSGPCDLLSKGEAAPAELPERMPPPLLPHTHPCSPSLHACVGLGACNPQRTGACNPQCLQPTVHGMPATLSACNPQCSACLQPSVHGQQCMLATLSAWPATLSARPAVHASNPQCTASSACLQPSVHGQLPSVHGPRPSVHGRGPSCWCAYPCMHATCGSIAGCHPLSPGCPKGYANHARMALLACTRDERMHAIRGACANSIGSEPGSTHA